MTGGLFLSLFRKPAPTHLALAFAATYFLAVLIGVAVAFRMRPHHRLELHTKLKRLTYTDRRRSLDIPFDRIDGWTTRERILASGNGVPDIFRTELLCLTADGESIPVHAFRHEAKGPPLAIRTARGLAELTGTRFRETIEDDDASEHGGAGEEERQGSGSRKG